MDFPDTYSFHVEYMWLENRWSATVCTGTRGLAKCLPGDCLGITFTMLMWGADDEYGCNN